MTFTLFYTESAAAECDRLERQPSSRVWKAVRKCLGLLETNPRHPGLNTHKFESLKGPNGEEVFEAYAQNRTAAAYRVFWCYGPGKGKITVIAVTPHP